MLKELVSFLKEAWSELGKVVWPSKNQTVRLTLAVLAITFSVAGLTAVLDYLFHRMLNFLVER